MGQGGTPHGGATNTNMADKIGQAVMNEIKVNIQEQVTSEISDYVHQTVQNDQQDGRNAWLILSPAGYCLGWKFVATLVLVHNLI